MWTSQRNGRNDRRDGEIKIEEGIVTLSGENLGVYVDGERRELPIFSPLGYMYRPKVGDRVLVLKSEVEGKNPVIVGVNSQENVETGEIKIKNGNSSIILKENGDIILNGCVKIGEKSLEDFILQVVSK